FANIEKNDPNSARGYLDAHKTDFTMASLSTSINQRVGEINNMMKQVRDQMSQPNADVAKGYDNLEKLYNAKLMMMRNFNAAADRYQKATAASPSKTEGWSR